MADTIGQIPTQFVIPVTAGTDRQFTLLRKDSDGVAQDWAADVYINIDIDKTAPTRVDATVAGDTAVVRIESTVCDLVKTGTRWRIVMSTDGDDPSETAVAVGVFTRYDGG
jgi:hypothetical protein